MKKILFIIYISLSLLYAKNSNSSLKMKSYNVITKVQELIEAKKYQKAKNKLDTYMSNIDDATYDKAYLQTIYGSLYIAQEQYSKALKAFEKAYAANILPEEMQHNLLYNLAQLYMSNKSYNKCIKNLKAWIQTAEQIKPENYIMLSQALVQTKRYNEALDPTLKAINLNSEKVENHYRLLFFIYYELGRYNDAIITMKKIIQTFKAKKENWMQLYGLYMHKENYSKALSVMEILYRKGYIQSENEYMQLYSLYMAQHLPYKAADILEKAMNGEQVITRNVKHFKMLGEAWLQARHYDKAIFAFREAANRSKKGDEYLIIAQLYADVHHWKKVIVYVDKGLQKGLKKPGNAYYLKGIALFELGKTVQAKESFMQAANDKKQKKRAEEWIGYLTQ